MRKLQIFLAFTLLLLLYQADQANSQVATALSSIKLTKPTDCNRQNQYYDISHLQCLPCPANSVPVDLYNCRCISSYYFLVNNGGGLITCSPCPTGQTQSIDGFSCIACDSTCATCGTTLSYLTDLTQQGTPQANRACVQCNAANSILVGGNRCGSCQPLVFVDSDATPTTPTQCNDPNIFASGGLLLVNVNNAFVVQNFYFSANFDSDIFSSWYFSQYLIPVYRTCQRYSKRNVTACQALGNMCVLNLYNAYSQNAGQLDACTAFNSVVKSPNAAVNSVVWGDYMPWLFYTQSFSAYANSYSLAGINGNGQYLTITYDAKCSSSALGFYAAKYELGGKFISFGELNVAELQLCYVLRSGNNVPADISPFAATNYKQSCSVSVQALLDYGTKPIFYDIYLKYSNGSTQLFPLPVQVSNFKFSTSSNTNSVPDSSGLQRRLFLVDAVSGIASQGAVPKYIRYAQSITIYFELFSNQAQGQIYPPLFKVNYGFVSTADLQAKVSVSYSIQYYMSLDVMTLVIWIVVGVCFLAAFVIAIIRTWIWNRRAGRFTFDLTTLFKFFMYLINYAANILFLVLVGVSLYWLIFFKAQSVAFVVLPDASQQISFVALIVGAFVLKLIDILHLIFTQTSYDIFFIDWERPKTSQESYVNNLLPMLRTKESEKKESAKEKLLRDDELNDYNRVSCWRLLFVANEWNELQTFRKINTTLNLIAVLFFLKVVNLEAITTSDCNSSVSPDRNAYNAPYNSILRVAMASSMWIGCALFQYIFYIILYSRCFEDRVTQFVDFCSVTNISMFIMTHTQYGYYIHGKSPHGNAESSMHQMIHALQKEKDDITSKRGLGQQGDFQTFSISISNKLSQEYHKALKPILEKRGKKISSDTFRSFEFEKGIIAYSRLNRFLTNFIDNIVRDMKYIITKKNFLENILDLEFKEPLLNGYFYADNDNSFQESIFCGQERKLFIFDLVLFLLVDYLAQNYVLAAFAVYIVIKLYNMLRNDLGQRNISRKTLVDKRFLV